VWARRTIQKFGWVGHTVVCPTSNYPKYLVLPAPACDIKISANIL